MYIYICVFLILLTNQINSLNITNNMDMNNTNNTIDLTSDLYDSCPSCPCSCLSCLIICCSITENINKPNCNNEVCDMNSICKKSCKKKKD